MYLQHFGLHLAPFEDKPDPAFFHSTPDREEALAAMECAVRHGGGAVLLLGDAGTGKTMLLRTFLRRLEEGDSVVTVTCPPGGAIDIQQELAQRLGISSLGGRSAGNKPAEGEDADRSSDVTGRLSGAGSVACGNRRTRALRSRLQRIARRGARTVLIVDQAENLNHEGLLDLAALIDLRESAGKCFAVIVSAQPQFIAATSGSDMARLRQELYSGRKILPLSPQAAAEYVRNRLRVAGAADQDRFDVGSLKRIHAHTAGVPRLINKVCDAAMVAAYGANELHVRVEVIEELMRSGALDAPLATTGDGSVETLSFAAPDRDGVQPADTAPSRGPRPASAPQERHGAFDNFNQTSPTGAHDAERQAMLLDSRMQRAGAVAAEMERQTERTQRACDRAEELISKLTAFADQIADRAEDLQARINLLLGNVSSASGVESRLRDAAAQYETAAGAAPQRAASIRADLQGALDRLAAEAASRVDQITHEQEGRVNALKTTVSACQALITRTESDLAALSQRATDACVALESRAERTVQGAERRVDSMLESMQKRQAGIDERLTGLSQGQRAADAATAALSATVEHVAGRLASLRSETHHLEKAAERIAAIAEQSPGPIQSKLAQAEALLAGSLAAHEKAAELQSRVSSTLLEIGAACARADEARSQAAIGQSIIERMTLNTARAEAVSETLLERVAAADRGRAEVDEAATRAGERIEHLEHQGRAAVELAARLESTVGEARSASEAASASAASGRSAVEMADSAARQLNAATIAAGKVLGNAAAQMEVAKKTQLALSEMMLGADDKLSRLASHQAAASQAVERVSEATRSAHAAISEIRAAANKAESAAKTAHHLDEIQSAAAQTLARLDSAVGLGSDTATGLQARIAQSLESESALRLGCEQAAQSLQRMERMAEAACRAHELRAELRDLLSRADQQHEQLAGAFQSGRAVADQVAEMVDVARETIETFHSTAQEGDQIAARVAEQIEWLRESEPALADIADRMNKLRSDTAHWEARMSEIADKATKMTEEPRQILSSARAQTAELERVLAAVRKIFGGLSQASLKAKEQADALDITGRTTAEQLANLAGSAGQATQTLSQWVAEAVRVQSRLETLLQAAPSIAETHSADRLRELADSLDSAAAPSIAVAADSGGATSTPPAGRPAKPLKDRSPARRGGPRAFPARTVPAQSVPLRPTAHRKNAEEIAAILEDARRAAEEA